MFKLALESVFLGGKAIHNIAAGEVFIDHLAEFVGNQFRASDVFAEGERPLHRKGIGGDVLLEVFLCQSLVAADNLGGVIQDQFTMLVGKPTLNTSRDDGFVHRENDHFIVGQQAILDRPGKPTLEENFSEQIRIVH